MVHALCLLWREPVRHLYLFSCLCLLGACSFDGSSLEARRCLDDPDCAAPQICRGGFCQIPGDAGERADLCAQASDCDNGVLCDGAERCDPADPAADPRGCLPGPPPEVDDGVACTVDLCDAIEDRVLHIKTADCCTSDEGCALRLAPTACQRATCDPTTLACALANLPGQPCDDGVGCTVDVCDEQGRCVSTPDDEACSDGELCNGDEVCDPALGCQPGRSRDGESCTSTCGSSTGGVCAEGVCVSREPPQPREGAFGLPGCQDGADNDCDGLSDAEDPDCWRPDALLLVAPAQAQVGQSAAVTLEGRLQGQAAHLDPSQVWCRALPRRAELALRGADALSQPHPEDAQALAWVARDTQGQPVALPAQEQGVLLCAGQVLETLDWSMPALAAPIQTLMGELELSPQALQGEQRVVISYATGGLRDGHLPVQVLLPGDEGLQRARFTARNGGGVNRLAVRVELLGEGSGCALVYGLRLYEVPNPGASTGFAPMSWGEPPQEAQATFERLDQEALSALLEPSQGAAHSLETAPQARTNGVHGLVWAVDGAQEAWLELPALSTQAALPWLELNLALEGANWALSGPLRLEWRDGQGRWRPLLATPPQEEGPAHLAPVYLWRERLQVLLPLEARAQAQLRLRLAWPSPQGQAEAWVDSLRVQSFTELEARAWATDPRAPEPGRLEAQVQAAQPGAVEVECLWTAPGAAPVVERGLIQFQ